MYDETFYQSQAEGSLRSAQEVVPIIMELVKPKSVVDLGCGIGTWLSVYKNLGVKTVLGIDGDYVARDMLKIDESEFSSKNLTKPLKINQRYDLVQTVEVAEHLEPRFAGQFVASLTELGDVIAFSAAIPSQLGTGHVNEQFIDYWAALFEKRGYYPIDCIRPHVWDNGEVESWYKQNIVLFVQEDYLLSQDWMVKERHRTSQSVLSFVHPELYKLRISMLLKVIADIAHQLLNTGNRDVAESLYKLVLHHDAGINDVWDALGRISADRKNFPTAIEQMSKAIASNPQSPYHFNIGQVYAASGNITEARKHLKAALKIDPGLTAAKSLLRKLK